MRGTALWKHEDCEGLHLGWVGGGNFDPWWVHDRQFRTEIVAVSSHSTTLSELLGFRCVCIR